MKKRRFLFKLVILASIPLIILAVDFVTYPLYTRPAAPRFDRGSNGLWLRYLWYFGEHSDAELKALARRLSTNGVRYAYFHVRSAGPDGTLKFRYLEKARHLTDGLKRAAPGVMPIAWVYVGSDTAKNGVDLTDKKKRRRLVAEAVWLVERCGFTGIQWDYEFCPDGDSGLLLLLDETRAALGDRAMISVASPMWYPATLWGWSEEYFRKVARRCDQIAVMCYDSFFYLPRAYVWLVSMQAERVPSFAAASGGECRVILGVPVYDGGTLGHITFTENISTALAGVEEGLERLAASSAGAGEPKRRSALDRFEGIAPFAEYTMDDTEWEQYRKWWLSGDAPAPR